MKLLSALILSFILVSSLTAIYVEENKNSNLNKINIDSGNLLSIFDDSLNKNQQESILILKESSSNSIKNSFYPERYSSAKSTVLSNSINANFEVKNSEGEPIKDALIIIQGISDSSFSQNKLTDSNGRVSFTLNKNEVFLYMAYKLSYKIKTDNFFASSDKNFKVSLEEVSNDQWYFYYFNNGEVEITFKSSDKTTTYHPGDSFTGVLEIRNVGNRNIRFLSEKSSTQIVDGETLSPLRAWKELVDLTEYNITRDLILKKNGWIRTKWSEGSIELCGGNLIGKYGDTTVELSGDEFLCGSESARDRNLFPKWILDHDYKLKIKTAYEIDNEEKNIEIISQEFFVENNEWELKIDSYPKTNLKANDEWIYQVIIPEEKNPHRSFLNFLDLLEYKLMESPKGMTISEDGEIKWNPRWNGNFNVSVRAYHEYFENNPDKIVYVNQEFTLTVTGGEDRGNINADRLHVFNTSVKVGDTVKISFRVHNNHPDENSFNYKIEKGNGEHFVYRIKDLKPYSARTIYTSFIYSEPGSFSPVLTIDSDNEIEELDKENNIKFFENITII